MDSKEICRDTVNIHKNRRLIIRLSPNLLIGRKLMKKNILFWVAGQREWIGGIYYIRNILYQISLIKKNNEKYRIFLCLDYELISEFKDLEKIIKIDYIKKDKTDSEQVLKICDENNIDIIMPIQGGKYFWILRDICIYLIPDFQEIYLPENFSKEQRDYRAITNEYIAKNHKCLILSSNDALADYKNLFPQYTKNVCVMHFTSFITDLVKKINSQLTQKIFEEFKITYQYLYVANQFWKHKNHIVVLKALKRLLDNGYKDIHLVCTGYMQSYDKNKDEYVQSLHIFIEQNNLENNVHFLGLLDRTKQLCLMKNSNLIIQPSLFEGWGCSVEDAKALGKKIILSDISVHREQGDETCVFFKRDDDAQLSKIILENFYANKKYDLKEGSKKIYFNALKYSQEFEQAIKIVGDNIKKEYRQTLSNKRKEKILELFGDLNQEYIGIYGTGIHTDNLLKSYVEVFGENKLVYFDSDSNKWGKEYHGTVINPPRDIHLKGLKRIIISSIKYQEEIYCDIRQYEKKMEIVKIYKNKDYFFETLW